MAYRHRRTASLVVGIIRTPAPRPVLSRLAFCRHSCPIHYHYLLLLLRVHHLYRPCSRVCLACCSHLCFHSSVLGFTSQRVLPLFTVASISHAPSILGMDVVTLVDRGGEAHSFGITAMEAGFPQRFHNLVKQCLVLSKVLTVHHYS